MIGFYNYTVIVTYMSLMCSLYGMVLCIRQSILSGGINGDYRLAVLMLALSGLCDMFDGKIARTKKDRTEQEKKFGIQLDSLCDVICFGAYPVLLAYCIGMRGRLSAVISIIYALGAVIRLAYFNVMEEERQKGTTEKRKVYQGLPVTSIAVIFPVLFFVGGLVSGIGHFNAMKLVLQIGMLITGILFVVDFEVKKPGNLTIAIFVLLVGIIMIFVFDGSFKKGDNQPKEVKQNIEQRIGEATYEAYAGENLRMVI